MTDWKPIETAPIWQGAKIRGAHYGAELVLERDNSQGQHPWGQRDDKGRWTSYSPTYWMEMEQDHPQPA
jgi:hypothetical protein